MKELHEQGVLQDKLTAARASGVLMGRQALEGVQEKAGGGPLPDPKRSPECPAGDEGEAGATGRRISLPKNTAVEWKMEL